MSESTDTTSSADKSLLSVAAFLLSLATKNQTIIIGALASVVVLVASDLNIVISNASIAAILAPVITAVLAELDKKVGVGNTIAKLLPPYRNKGIPT